MNSWLCKSIGLIVLQRRKATNLSLSEFAKRCNIPVRQLVAIERGHTDVDVVTLNNVCATLGITLSKLFAEAYIVDVERVIVCGPLDNANALRQDHRDVVTIDAVEECQRVIETQRFDVVVIASSDISLTAPKVWKESQIKRVGVVVVGEPPNELLPAANTVRVATQEHVVAAVDQLLTQLPKGKICSLRRSQDELRRRREELAFSAQQMIFKHKQLTEQLNQLVTRQAELYRLLAGRPMGNTERTLAMLERLQDYRIQLDRMAQAYKAEDKRMQQQYDFARHRERFLLRQEQRMIDFASDF